MPLKPTLLDEKPLHEATRNQRQHWQARICELSDL